MSVTILRDGELVEISDAEWAEQNPPGSEPQAPVPDVISDRQFGDGLWDDGIISFAECEAFVSVGAIPGPLQAIVDALPDDSTGAPTPRKSAIILIKGAKEYQRSNPLVEIVRQALEVADPKWTPDYLDARWRVWASL